MGKTQAVSLLSFPLVAEFAGPQLRPSCSGWAPPEPAEAVCLHHRYGGWRGRVEEEEEEGEGTSGEKAVSHCTFCTWTAFDCRNGRSIDLF